MKNIKKPSKKLYTDMAKKLTTSEQDILKVVEKVVDWKPVKLHRLIEGVGNEVYKVISPNNEYEDFILRINHKTNKGFLLEKWAFDQLDNSVPTPTIITIGDYEKKLYYCAEKILDGKPLDKILEKIDVSDAKEYAVLCGEILAKIHLVPTVGFGHFSSPGIGEYASLEESMNQKADYSDILKISALTNLSNEDIHKALRIIDQIDNTEQPHLIHVDFAPKHIFFKQKSVTGVIDFEICMSGIAATDFNRLRAQDNRLDIELVKKGYEKIKKLPDNFWDIMYAVQIHSAMRTMLYHFRISLNEQELNKANLELKYLLETGKPLVK